MTTPKVSAPELATAQASKEATANEAFRRLEAGSGLFRVEDNDATAPPGSCADGAQYIPAATATGAWAGKEGYIAIAVGANAANGWYFIAPEEGMRAWIKDENAEFAYDGAAWTAYTVGSGSGALLAANNLSDVANAATARTNLGVDYTTLDERARDAVGTALTDTGLAVVTVNDGADTIDINVPAAVDSDFRTGTDATKALTSDAVWDAAAYVALTPGTNVATDMASGLNFTLAMGGNYTLDNPTNTKPGQSGCIVITQDGTGSRTLAYGTAWKFAGGTDPVLSTAASSVDVLFYQVQTSSVIFASLSKAFA
jgi:hypothetical protein